MSENNFWKDKRVTITGGSGFLGSFVVKKLLARGLEKENLFIPRSENYDLTRPDHIDRMLAVSGNIDILIHLAALAGGIGANMERPADFFYKNIMMGIPLMHKAYENNKTGKFVALGTICAYPVDTETPFREETLWDGYPEETNAPYGLAKKMLLVQAQAYRQQYDYNAIYLLPVNLYGPRDNFDLKTSHVIPALIRKFLEAQENGQEVQLWGTGSPTREFLYVEDAAEGIVLAAEKYDGSEPVNLGSGMEISIKDLAETIGRLTGYTGKVVWDSSKPDGQPKRRLDVSRAEEYFDFRAATDFETGLKKTIEWYRKQVQVKA